MLGEYGGEIQKKKKDKTESFMSDQQQGCIIRFTFIVWLEFI